MASTPPRQPENASAGIGSRKEKTMFCSICHKGFTNADGWKKHMEKFHPDKAKKEIGKVLASLTTGSAGSTASSTGLTVRKDGSLAKSVRSTTKTTGSTAGSSESTAGTSKLAASASKSTASTSKSIAKASGSIASTSKSTEIFDQDKKRNVPTRCYKCEGCQRYQRKEDCGDCKHCRDKSKNGGPNTIRKPCVMKKCEKPSTEENGAATSSQRKISDFIGKQQTAEHSTRKRKLNDETDERDKETLKHKLSDDSDEEVNLMEHKLSHDSDDDTMMAFQFDFDKFPEQAGDLKWLEGKKGDTSAEKEECLNAARKMRKNLHKSSDESDTTLSILKHEMKAAALKAKISENKAKDKEKEIETLENKLKDARKSLAVTQKSAAEYRNEQKKKKQDIENLKRKQRS